MTTTLLLKNGRVIDPANKIDGVMDVAIQDGKVARVAANIPADTAAKVIDASGCLVTPGILDIHTHVYNYIPSLPGALGAVNADAHLFASGVTTTVDVGTAGWKNFADFQKYTIDVSKVRVLAFLNIAANGMTDNVSEQTMSEMQPKLAASMVEAFPEWLLGIKTAHYWTQLPWDEQHLPWASVERAVEAGELCGKPVMVDFWPRLPERPYPDLILKKLRPGDIHTHVFAQQFPVVGADGKTSDFLFKARERGVLFDLGHGAGSFWFRNAVPAFRDGFPPDTLSTDLHMGSINGPALSMQNVMSKFLNIGMPLQEVIWRSTQRPAERSEEDNSSVFMRDVALGCIQINQKIMSLLDCTYDQAEMIKFGEDTKKLPADERRQIISAVVTDWCTEIRRALDFFYTNYPDDQIKRIILSGGGANIAEFRKLLASEASAPVETLNPFHGFSFDEKSFDSEYIRQIGPQAAIAMGLVLRRVDDK